MNRFQAIPGGEVTRLRADSAAEYGAMFFTEAVRELSKAAGIEAAERLCSWLGENLAASDTQDSDERRRVELAVEQLQRTLQLVRDGRSELRGWTLEAPPAVEERKP
jgi:hypothetical protein